MKRSRTYRWLISGALAVGLLALAAPAAHAQESRCDDELSDTEDTGKKKKNYRTVRGADGKKVFVIEKAFVVCGKVPKPTVIYILQASTINYEWETLKQDFLPKVLKSVKKAPF